MGYTRFGSSSGSEPPVGTTVDTLLVGNDPSKPNWVKMNKNTFIDTTTYPSFIGITEGVFSPTTVTTTGGNISSLVTGTWVIRDVARFNGYFFCVASDVITPTAYARSFRSVDGVTWTEMGQLPNVTSYPQQNRLYFFNNKLYSVSTVGVHESSNNATSWIQKNTTYFYTMGYHGGLYLLSNSSGDIYSSTDLVTNTLRYDDPDSTQPITGFLWSNTFNKFYAVVNSGVGTKVIYSSDGISGWTEVSVATNNHVYEAIVEFNDVLYVFTRTGGTSNTGWAFKSINGTTFTDCSSEFGLTSSSLTISYQENGLISTSNYLIGAGNNTGSSANTLFDTTGAKPRLLEGADSGHMSLEDGYVWSCANGSSTVIIKRYPDTPVANKVILPVANKMVRVY